MIPVHSFQVYVGNLSPEITDRQLYDHFNAQSGKVVNALIVRHRGGTSMGYGFVKYESDEHAMKAVSAFNSLVLPMKSLGSQRMIVRETYLRSRAEIDRGVDHERSRTIFVGNVNVLMGDEDLHRAFSKFGPIQTSRVVANRGFGFVTFAENVSAIAALSEMQNVEVMHQRLYCTWGRRSDQPADVQAPASGEVPADRDEDDYYETMFPRVQPGAVKEDIQTEEISEGKRKELLKEALQSMGLVRDDKELTARNEKYIIERMSVKILGLN